MSLVQVSALTNYLGVTPAPGDPQDALDAAEAYIAALMGLDTLAEQTGLTQLLEPARITRELPVSEGPIVAVESLAAAGDSWLDGSPLGAGDLVVSPWSIRLKDEAAISFFAHQRLVLTYTTGWASAGTLPQAIVSGVLALASFIASGRDRGITSERLGDYSYSIAADPTRSDPEKSLPASTRIALQQWRAPLL